MQAQAMLKAGRVNQDGFGNRLSVGRAQVAIKNVPLGVVYFETDVPEGLMAA